MAKNGKKNKKKIIIFSIIGLLIIALGLVVFLGSRKEPVITVQVEKVQARTLTQVVTATGKIQPEVQVKITPTNLSKDAKKTSRVSSHDGETDLVRHLKKEAVGNPVIQEAVEIFQGRIVEVKVKEGS